jgi:hypothetical protein
MRERLQARARSVGISAYSVGVIPFNEQDCPHNTLVVLDMDDESSDNRNSVDGWIGAITNGIASSGNNHTIFRFCKVDGTQFKSLPPQGLQGMRAYALLKLGNSCPAGSTEFRRYFDNEDAYNENGWANSPDIYPNYMRKNTELQFCLFTVGSDSMTDFPELKDINSHLLQYGVFAHTFPEEPDSGKLHIDDEDDDNRNKYVVPQAVKDVAQRIISDGKNTDIWVARVK